MPRQCSNAPMAMRALLALFFGVLLLAGAPGARAQFAVADSDAAGLRQAVVDLLARERSLPLPIKQRRAVLSRYYGELKGDLLWLTNPRTRVLVLRIANAPVDG